MPNKEGMELICELQQEYPDVKIIVMSGGGKVETELYLESASKIPNVKATLKKPFEINDLLRVIKNIGE